MIQYAGLSADAVRLILRDSITGLRPWNVRLGHGTYVFLDFGDPIPSGHGAAGPHRGSVQLWIVEAMWRIEDDGRLRCGSDDEGTTMANGLALLVGQTLTSASLTDPLLDLRLTFENGFALQTFRCSSDEDSWRLFGDASTVFHAPDGSFARELVALGEDP